MFGRSQPARHIIGQRLLVWPISPTALLYRLRWRIELAIIGLKASTGFDERTAKPYVLAHLLMILMLEPLIGDFEDSPRRDAAA